MIDSNIKFLIIGANNIDKETLAQLIVEKNDDMSLSPRFSTNPYFKNKLDESFIYYMDPKILYLSYKNNAIVYSKIEDDGYSTGISIDDFNNNDILFMNIEDFNNLSESILRNNNILVIWLDTKHNKDNAHIIKDINETKYLIERLDFIQYMYFLDEDYNDIANTIIKYYYADDENKKRIIEDNL